MSYVRKILSVPGFYRSFTRGARIQKKFIKAFLEPEIAAIERENDGSLTEKDFRKIRSYYGYAVAAVAGEGYCILRGKAMTEQERLVLTCLGAITGLGDDMFDEKRTPLDHIKALILDPDTTKVWSSNEALFIRLYKKALEHMQDIPALKKSFLEVMDAQVLSLKQENPDISGDEIRHITRHKGGVSILFYRHAFREKISKAERDMLYQLGGIGQFENDLFDVYDDLTDHIHTLVTREERIQSLRHWYEGLIEEFSELVYQTDYPLEGKRRFLDFSMLIMARGLVCLDFLEKTSRKTDGIFAPIKYERKDLICDMGKTGNILRNIHYFAKTEL